MTDEGNKDSVVVIRGAFERINEQMTHGKFSDSSPDEPLMPQEAVLTEANRLMSLAITAVNSFPEFQEEMRKRGQEIHAMNDAYEMPVDKYGGFAFQRGESVWWVKFSQGAIGENVEKNLIILVSDPQKRTSHELLLYAFNAFSPEADVLYSHDSNIPVDMTRIREFKEPRSHFPPGTFFTKELLIDPSHAVDYDSTDATTEFYSDKQTGVQKVRDFLKSSA